MNTADNIKKFFKNSAIATHPRSDKAVLNRVLTAHDKTKPAKIHPFIRYIIMKNPITKLATAAAIIIAACSIVHFTGTPNITSAAWGQVIEAFSRANNVHIIKTGILEQGVAVDDHEAWIKNQTLFRVEADNYCIVDDGRHVLTLYKGLMVAHIRDSFTPYWDYTPLILKVFRDGLSEKGITVTRSVNEGSEAADVYEIDFRGRWSGTASAASRIPRRTTRSSCGCSTAATAGPRRCGRSFRITAGR